ncbi:PREDICTED: SH3 and multiple ankyrin repeat domains protein 3-like [Priapulus caudatus]|uniref:SH3 and multiple ankyrin repeat domains protein 3-like n=1 Tax=Priapulus caudatus TaxID=37621 RepID=A0ABM1E9V4_PRICU|nr:PREDICTED: SH3 and multiple ankyrin repeat domains protein 3-like [Priapulus caudatus]
MTLMKDLKDACNFGLYCPPANGRAGKFLEEERPMRDYPLTGPIGYLEFKYKRRLYKALHMDEKQLKQLHTKVCKHGFAQHLDLLLFYGAEMNAKNASGNTPLHVCCINNQDSCARLLLFRGADKNAQNFANQTPYQVSVVAGNLELADIIKNHGTDEIVPFRETPKYSNRRRMSVAAHPGTPQYARPDRWQGKAPSPAQSTRSLPQFSSAGSTLSLSDSSSNMNHADVDDSASSYNSGKSSNSTSPVYVSPKKRLYPAMPGRTFVCVKPYLPKEDGELALKKGDFVDVLSIGERGFWEGKVGHREGWFPNDYVEEVQMRRRKGSDSDDEDSVILNKNTLAALVSGQLDHQPKTVVLQRSNKGFGFVLRGARSLGAKLNFHPTDQFPALQYLDDVDKDGMGWKAGLRPGDFVIEVRIKA